MKIVPVIMCGGTGTRVWPESRESLPKQFISLVGPHSTFQMATEMLADGVFETPIVISNHDYRFLVAEQLQKVKREARIVLEPIRRDSGPAVAVAAELAAQSGPGFEPRLTESESAVLPLNYPPDGRRSSVGWTYPRRAS